MAAPVCHVSAVKHITRRFLSCSVALQKTGLKKSKGNQSSNNWLQRQLNDPYVKSAQTEHFRCRSAFKLLEINDRFKIIRPGDTVIDCGAAPGSWSQVAARAINKKDGNKKDGMKGSQTRQNDRDGMVIGVDLQEVEPIEGVLMFSGHDFTLPDTQHKILNTLDNMYANVVLSDMAPSASGNKAFDHERISKLCLSVLKFSSQVLANDGHVVCKLWDGSERKDLLKVMERMFRTVKVIKPDASRSDSAEIFLLGMEFYLRK
ncbi:MRM2-like protein [Mya arenaria]|uniref:rRNA methyltransferase 2, mitochondrial n=1 Tax=Mya arenaria TaxID=6604 RepID=A0ABY7DJV8_MYAAR|nr:ribosomal RNA large subunit methyltransferase E-like [Mya arenaria]WAQ97163.1 MRM2-like protein [Mya arenaria]